MAAAATGYTLASASHQRDAKDVPVRFFQELERRASSAEKVSFVKFSPVFPHF